jgi:hypothetical protein
MDSVEYVRGSRPRLEPDASGVVTMVSQTLKNFADVTTPHCIANTGHRGRVRRDVHRP